MAVGHCDHLAEWPDGDLRIAPWVFRGRSGYLRRSALAILGAVKNARERSAPTDMNCKTRSKGSRMSRCWPGTLAVVAVCLAANATAAQDSVEAFYRNRTVTITVGSAAGGGYHTYARLVARHLGKFIPGSPTIVVQNIPGAGSNKAASYVALQAP